MQRSSRHARDLNQFARTGGIALRNNSAGLNAKGSSAKESRMHPILETVVRPFRDLMRFAKSIPRYSLRSSYEDRGAGTNRDISRRRFPSVCRAMREPQEIAGLLYDQKKLLWVECHSPRRASK